MSKRDKVMLPAADTARVNRWRTGTWINAKKWKRPRRIVSVWGPWVEWAQCINGRTRGNYLVKSFPADVHRVADPR